MIYYDMAIPEDDDIRSECESVIEDWIRNDEEMERLAKYLFPYLKPHFDKLKDEETNRA
tara:strand:+ start:189 stop:365 length:177 start_codon:yes stop_codon:yes gene_type:complete